MTKLEAIKEVKKKFLPYRIPDSLAESIYRYALVQRYEGYKEGYNSAEKIAYSILDPTPYLIIKAFNIDNLN